MNRDEIGLSILFLACIVLVVCMGRELRAYNDTCRVTVPGSVEKLFTEPLQ